VILNATLPEQIVGTTGEASTEVNAWERVSGWSILDEVERGRSERTHTPPVADPDVQGWGTHYFGGRRVDMSFAGQRLEIPLEYRDEFAFDARASVWVEDDTARYDVWLAGYARMQPLASRGRFVGIGRPTYASAYASGRLPEQFDLVGILKPTPRRQRKQPLSRAYRACRDLATWLTLTEGEVSDIVGVSRGTLNNWKHGGEPRQAKTAREVYQLQAVVRALRNRLGGEGLRAWLRRGNPRPFDLLEQGDLDRFERLADDVIFPREDMPARRVDAADPPAPAESLPMAVEDAPKKRSSRVRSSQLAP
jgi:hypothetical protein